MVDALALRDDEGRGMAALSVGEMPNNRYIPRCPNEETQQKEISVGFALNGKVAYPGK